MLELKNIKIKYLNKHILSGASFQAPDFGLCAIFGESGSGKSSLLRSILLEEHHFEQYLFHDLPFDEATFKKDYLASVPQEAILIQSLKLKDHLKLLSTKQNPTVLIQKLHLSSCLNKYPDQLSGGERKRAALFLALLRNQPILVLDEPTSSQDEDIALEIIEVLQDYAHDHLVIVATHDRRIVDVSETVYEIADHQLHLIRMKSTDEQCHDAPSHPQISWKQKLSLYLNLKKKRKIYHSLIYILLILSLTLTSFGLSKLVDSAPADDALDKVYNRDIFVYKQIDEDLQPDYSKNGSEFPFTNEEINGIATIDHVSTVYDNYLIGQSINSYLPEEMNHHLEYVLSIGGDLESREITLLDQEQNIIHSNAYPIDGTNMGLPLTVGVYYEELDYTSNIAVETHVEDGIYLSKSFAQQLGIQDLTSDEVYYIQMNFSVPQYNAYNDAYILVDEETTIDMCEVRGPTVNMTFPVSGILNQSAMGANVGTATSFFMPYSMMQDIIDQYRATESIDYVSTDAGYVRYDHSYETSARVMHCVPYQANSLIVIADSASHKQAIMDELEHLGYHTSSTISMNIAAQFANNTESNIFMLAFTALFFVAIIFFIISYLNIKEELSIDTFFQRSGYDKKTITHLMLGKYWFDFLWVTILSLIIAQIYFRISANLGYFLVSADLTYPLFLIVLSFLILFIYPSVLYLFARKKSK